MPLTKDPGTLTLDFVASKGTSKKYYTFEEALEESTKYFNGDELAANVWINKYAIKDSSGNLYEKTPRQMHQRISKELARIEKRYPNPMSEEELFNLLDNFKYIVPQGGPMTGVGNNYQIASLSNCFVIGAVNQADSYGNIMKTDEELVQLMKRRGGVGLDLSHIRPKGSPVLNSALTSTGIVPFMERFSNSTREVAQDGRRGALMLSVAIGHPDSESFIDAKLDTTKVTGANVSVRIDDKFMKAVEVDGQYKQTFPVGSDEPLTVRPLLASKLWKKIVHNAWKSAEPGILFWDTIARESVADCYEEDGFKTVSTNPCGEIPLCPYDSCRLLAINLYSYVDEPFTTDASFNFLKFKQHVAKAQRILDDLIDLEIEKIDKILEKISKDPEDDETKRTEFVLWNNIKTKAIQGRRTGLGITAEGDMLAALGIKYGSDEGIEFSTKVHKTLAIEAYRSSTDMATERGSFPIFSWEKEKANPFIDRLINEDDELGVQMKKSGRRNISLLTIAPTGTTSMMTQTTSGIEPAFMISYKRRRKVNPGDLGIEITFTDDNGDAWQEHQIFHPKFEDYLRANQMDVKALEKMSDEELKNIIDASPYGGATSQNIDWVQKVKMQGEIQKWVDHSISVTVNLPANVTEEKVGEVYMAAWKSGCKGVTVYREGSRTGVIVSASESESPTSFMESNPPRRPEKLNADVIRFQNNEEKWMAVVGLYEGKPYEVFTGKAEDSFSLPKYVSSGRVSKTKDKFDHNRYDFQYVDRDGYRVMIEGLSRSFNKEYWNYAKLISGILRHGMPIIHVVDLIGNLNMNDESLNTWKNGVTRALMRYIPAGAKPVNNECGECEENSLVYEEGCLKCKNCGFSKCG